MNYFSRDELVCKCGCNKNYFNAETLEKLNRLRQAMGKPIVLNSAYRCPKYNEEIGATQTHATGRAVDIKCSYKDAYNIIELAFMYGFTGIGVQQKGQSRFIHLDDLEQDLSEGRPRPHVWSY